MGPVGLNYRAQLLPDLIAEALEPALPQHLQHFLLLERQHLGVSVLQIGGIGEGAQFGFSGEVADLVQQVAKEGHHQLLVVVLLQQ